MAPGRIVRKLCLSVSLLILWISASPVAFCGPVRVGSVECPDLRTALAQAPGRTLIVDTAQMVSRDLTIPADVDLVFEDRGRLVRDPSVTQSIGLNLEGTVTAPIRTIFEGFAPGEVSVSVRRVREVYPQWWGAVGDGVADDTDALQSAISGAANVYVPKGDYRITRPLDATHKRDGFRLVGQSNQENRGAVLIGDTGGIVLDMTGSNNTHLEDLYIRSGKTNPSTIGLLYARSAAFGGSEPHSLTRVRVDFNSIPEANGGLGTIPIYNCCAEGWKAFGCPLNGDQAIVFTSENIFGITSPYREAGTVGSMTYITLFMCTLTGFTRPAVLLEGTAHVQFVNCAVTGNGDNTPEGLFAFDIVGSNYTVSFTGDIENGYRRLIRCRGHLHNSEFRASFTGMSFPETDPVILVDGTGPNEAGLTNCALNLEWYARYRQPGYVFLRTEGDKVVGVQHCEMLIYHDARIDARQGVFIGNVIHSLHADPEIMVNESAGAVSYVVYSPKGVEVVGPLVHSKRAAENE